MPAWQTKNPARTLLNEERDRRWREEAGRSNHRPSRHNPPAVIVVPQYRFFPYTLPGSTQYIVSPPAPTEVVDQRTMMPPPPEPVGILRLEVEPKELLQIYVDGVYLGTPADLGDELALAPGTRRVELRARGHKTVVFSAEIVDARSITYRATLEPLETAPAAPPPAVIIKPSAPGSRTIYVLPGCYVGNVPPVQSSLRAGCDVSKVSKIEP